MSSPCCRALLLIAVAVAASTAALAATPPGAGTLLRGNFHIHTIASASATDHWGAEDVSVLLGRAAGYGLNCLGTSDHAEAVTATEWSRLWTGTVPPTRVAVALRGFEWTWSQTNSWLSPAQHMNVWGTRDTAIANAWGAGASFGKLKSDPTALYNWLVTAPTVYAAAPVAQFNHMDIMGPHFNEWAMPAGALGTSLRQIVCLGELAIVLGGTVAGGGEGQPQDAFSLTGGEARFRAALAKGWRLAPALGADNVNRLADSSAKWHTAIYLLPGQTATQANTLAALRERRVFASMDKTAVAQLWCGSYFMGSQGVAVTSPATFTVQYQPSSTGGSNNITASGCRFVVDGVEVAPTSGPTKNGLWWTWTLRRSLTRGSHWTYARLIQTDGDRIFTAPIWVKAATAASPALALSAAGAAEGRHGTAQISFSLSAPAGVSVRIVNLAGRLVRELPWTNGQAGLNRVLWDGRAATGQAVPAGQYLVQIVARGPNGAACQALVPCHLRRR